MRWPEVREYLRAHWKPTHHTAVFAPTETGKTYLISRGLLPLVPYSVTLDFKPRDPDNVAHARALGAKWCTEMPQPDLGRLWGKDPYPDHHYWINPPPDKIVETIDKVFKFAWLSGSPSSQRPRGMPFARFVINVDELKHTSARPPDGYGQAHHLIRVLRMGRNFTQLIGATQSPKYNGPGMGDLFDQTRWTWIGYTPDDATVVRYGEISGFPRAVAREVIPSLGEHEWWVLGPRRFSARVTLPGPSLMQRNPQMPRRRAG